ncbi:MAG: hypothetical protein COB37_08440 [Kordiimonadales bacterium]|nr:MAG: hypothetical protein COB37_08440 [Kordiimonadales bacterium]
MKYVRALAVSAAVFGMTPSVSAEASPSSNGLIVTERAALPPLTRTLTRIAFGSCADEELPQPIWKHISAQKPDLFLFTGDNIYADYRGGKKISNHTTEMIARSYRDLAGHPDFTQFRKSVPIMATWDDHDYGKDDAGAEFPLKEASKGLMFKFFGWPHDTSVQSRDGVYHSAIFGAEGQRLQIIMLDTRWFRSSLKRTDKRGAKGKERFVPDRTASKTMLGDAQWEWLATELAKPADLRILVSSIQVLAEGHGWEAWRTLPLERERLLKLLDSQSVENLILMSGDRHVGGFYQLEREGRPALREVTSSSINKSYFNGKVPETGPHQIGELYGPENFGLLEIDWQAKQVLMSLKDVAGDTVMRQTVPFSTLLRLDS